MIPEKKWFTNFYTRGNRGCASIYLMLEELFNSDKLQPGQKIFCFVPESGRCTTAYMMLTAVENTHKPMISQISNFREVPEASPLDSVKPENSHSPQAYLLRELTWIWLKCDREIRSVLIVRKLYRGELTIEDYQAFLCNLRPQAVEGARWIARAASNMSDFRLRSTFIGHAQDEHRDYQMLEQNYVSVGGEVAKIVEYDKNIGSNALSAFIFHQASRENPVDLIDG